VPVLQSLIADGVGIKLGVVVCDLSDLGKTGKANSFFYKAVVASSRVITVSAAHFHGAQ
jgi:hypothetical protein